jgi:hypothetical protein
VLSGLSNSFGIDATANASTYTLSVAGTLTNGNYTVTGTTDGSWTVDPKGLTITADNQSKIYDGLVFAGPYTVTYNGFVNGEDESVLSGALNFSGPALTATAIGGPYAIIASGLTATNYVVAFVDGSLLILPAPLPPETAPPGAELPEFLAFGTGEGTETEDKWFAAWRRHCDLGAVDPICQKLPYPSNLHPAPHIGFGPH